MRDVAERAGVAPATVSNVLSGRRQVRPALKERVLAAIAEINYRPNQLASSLRLMRSNTIGILVPDLTNPFFAALVHRLEDLAAEGGYQILLASSNEDEKRQAERLRTLLMRRVDGLIIAPTRDETKALMEQRVKPPPTVLMDRGFGEEDFDTVTADNGDAGREGCRHLIALGHRDIAFVVTSTALANMRERREGYLAALREAGLGERARVIAGGFDLDGCRNAVEQELRRAEPPTAIFAANYVATLGAVKAIRGLDLDFPSAVSLLGFDDSDWMTVLRPYLSVIVQPVRAMADLAWELLRERLGNRGRPYRHVRLPCALSIRESTQPPPLPAQRSGVARSRPNAPADLGS
ncbi:MAG TPA: LacI family DNA-binding transcriptional regulator [Acetobacteraceae bacterium]|nr:LacI family DNA-binding transcriptional regulator [Acetobacteraceae bacterium]